MLAEGCPSNPAGPAGLLSQQGWERAARRDTRHRYCYRAQPSGCCSSHWAPTDVLFEVRQTHTTGTCRKLFSIMSSMAASTVSPGVTVFRTLSGVMISSTLSVAELFPDTTTFVR